MSYGYLFKDPVDDISGDIRIDLENLPPEIKLVILQIVQNKLDRDMAQERLSEVMKQIEFDVTAAELQAYFFKPGNS